MVVELEQVDSTGRVLGSGKTRLRQFDRSAGTVHIETPTKAGRPVVVAEGELVRIYIIEKTAIHKFESRVLARETIRVESGQNVPAIKLEAPTDLVNGNRRRHFRVTPLSNAPVTLNWRVASRDKDAKNLRSFEKCKITDISGRGVGILVAAALVEKLGTGQLLELEMQLPTGSTTAQVRTKALIRRIVPSPDGERPALLGIEFLVESRDPDAAIEEIVAYATYCQIEVARTQRERGD